MYSWLWLTGEGLKIGTLALLRKGHKVLIATKNGTWNFSIEKHPKLGEDVLTVTIEGTLSQKTYFIDYQLILYTNLCFHREYIWNSVWRFFKV